MQEKATAAKYWSHLAENSANKQTTTLDTLIMSVYSKTRTFKNNVFEINFEFIRSV